MTQVSSPNELQRYLRAMLYSIHIVFPSPTVSTHNSKEPVSIKNLKQGE